eukprot:2128562-Amphidinium_carterae.1
MSRQPPSHSRGTTNPPRGGAGVDRVCCWFATRCKKRHVAFDSWHCHIGRPKSAAPLLLQRKTMLNLHFMYETCNDRSSTNISLALGSYH